jgi:hypothetical protein
MYGGEIENILRFREIFYKSGFSTTFDALLSEFIKYPFPNGTPSQKRLLSL